MNLLVVDWDYFFPNHEHGKDWPLYDWGHSESMSEDTLSMLWQIRAMAFWRAGLPLPGLNHRLIDSFWRRFNIAPRAQLFYADSNSQAANERVHKYVSGEVWLFDAHHDCGYHPGAPEHVLQEQRVSCEDWMIAYSLAGVKLHVRYPQWRGEELDFEPEPEIEVDMQSDDELPVNVVFDRVFVCRSSAWVPPWTGDHNFLNFITHAPVQRRVALDDRANHNRPWVEDEVREVFKEHEQAMNELHEMSHDKVLDTPSGTS